MILPPSVHPTGSRYAWSNDHALAPFPSALVDNLGSRPKAADHPRGVAGLAPEGARNNALASYLGGLRRRGAGDDDLRQAALEFNNTHCSPPLSVDEALGVAHSISKYPAEFLDLDEAINELNRTYAVVQIGGRVRVMQEWESSVEFLPRDEFVALFANRFVRERDKTVTLGAAFLRHPQRRYYSRVVFHPGGQAPEGTFNLWSGWGCNQARRLVNPSEAPSRQHLFR